jgi:hypothetical protein
VVGRMTLIELQQYTISEKRSEEYLQVQDILERFDQCPTRVTGKVESDTESTNITDVGKKRGRDEELYLKV